MMKVLVTFALITQRKIQLFVTRGSSVFDITVFKQHLAAICNSASLPYVSGVSEHFCFDENVVCLGLKLFFFFN